MKKRHIVYRKITHEDCIPYQVCPLCDGVGTIQNPHFNPNVTGSDQIITCSVCRGDNVIPMHISEINCFKCKHYK